MSSESTLRSSFRVRPSCGHGAIGKSRLLVLESNLLSINSIHPSAAYGLLRELGLTKASVGREVWTIDHCGETAQSFFQRPGGSS